MLNLRGLLRLLGPGLAFGVLLISLACDGKLRRNDEPRAGLSGERSEQEQAAWDELAAEDDDGGYGAESDRTAAMEEQAAEMQRIYDDAMANAQTPEEKIQAYQEFEDARRELNRMAEGESGGDAYSPPP